MKIFSIDNIFSTIVVLLVLKFLPVIFQIDFLDPIQNTVQDFDATDIVFSQLRQKDYKNVPVDSNIILVNIGELNRKGIAKELFILNSCKPKVIGIDAFFRKAINEEQDNLLEMALSDVENLVLVSKLECYNDKNKRFDSLLIPFLLTKNKDAGNPNTVKAHLGFANMITDEDEFRTVRYFSNSEYIKNEKQTFFAVQVAKLYNSEAVKRFLNKAKETEFINFKRNIDKYITLDVDDILSGNFNPELIKGKIVLMGFLGPNIHTPVSSDVFFTPMNHEYLGKTYPDMYGVVIHANIISMLLNGEYINTLPGFIILLITILIIYFNMALFNYINTRNEKLYEPANILITLFELIFIFIIMIVMLYYFNFELGFEAMTLFGIIFSAACYELYHDSLKPIAVEYYYKIRTKKLSDGNI